MYPRLLRFAQDTNTKSQGKRAKTLSYSVRIQLVRNSGNHEKSSGKTETSQDILESFHNPTPWAGPQMLQAIYTKVNDTSNSKHVERDLHNGGIPLRDEVKMRLPMVLDGSYFLQCTLFSVKFDDRDNQKPGWKFAEYELKGVPVRLALGPRDIENHTVEVARRDTLEKEVIPMDKILTHVTWLLEEIQQNIYKKALEFRNENTFKVDKWDDFIRILDNTGGFILAHWDGTPETEEKIKEETKATIRCIPFDSPDEDGKCIYSGKPSKRRALFARSY